MKDIPKRKTLLRATRRASTHHTSTVCVAYGEKLNIAAHIPLHCLLSPSTVQRSSNDLLPSSYFSCTIHVDVNVDVQIETKIPICTVRNNVRQQQKQQFHRPSRAMAGSKAAALASSSRTGRETKEQTSTLLTHQREWHSSLFICRATGIATRTL